MKSWGEQIDELVAAGSYLDALSLLDTLDIAVVSDKVIRMLASICSLLTPVGPTSHHYPIVVCGLAV